ncbi:hypothetical protein [Brasilonema sp. UFV-L1]|uniref:hypothetical protein n=1 Tax=Brasilonema sp. UFV-L1 TaxID=2234130 RepID=UPI00145D1AF2|nr:hypothetical protein [Brasilonema sp. UFV-L1]NMG10828.1 hypothetical protein [Brasilonema sp. UFV-L1]
MVKKLSSSSKPTHGYSKIANRDPDWKHFIKKVSGMLGGVTEQKMSASELSRSHPEIQPLIASLNQSDRLFLVITTEVDQQDSIVVSIESCWSNTPKQLSLFT